MTKKELETQIRNWLYEMDYEKMELFIIKLILEYHLKQTANKNLNDIEDWEKLHI